jgi:hypothetical protein
MGLETVEEGFAQKLEAVGTFSGLRRRGGRV